MSKRVAEASHGQANGSERNLCGFEGARKGKRSGRDTEAKAKREQSRREGRTEAERTRTLKPQISGDNSLRDPPVPIPNTEVKPQHADSTWLETAREGRSSPDSIQSLFFEQALFFLLVTMNSVKLDLRRALKCGRV